MNKSCLIHVITGLNIGGAELALYHLLKGDIAKHYRCIVISLMDEGPVGVLIKRLNIPVFTLNMNNGRLSLRGIMLLRKLVKDIKPDIIQGWMYHGNLLATFAQFMASKHTALAWNVRHSLYDINCEKFITRQVINLSRLLSSRPDVLIYNAQVSQKQHESFGFSSKNSQTIPNGFDIDKFLFSSLTRQKIRSELTIPEDFLVIGHVARFHPMKDHASFLRAAVYIAQHNTNIHFILAGLNVSIENQDFKKLIPAIYCNRFHLLGERKDVHELMCAMDFFCSSSAWGEGFPNVIGEAMATSLPCVVTDVGDSKMIIGDTGIVVSAQSEKELISGIDKLISLSDQERQNLRIKARLRIEKKFTLTLCVKQYTSLYSRLISNTLGEKL